MGRPAVAKPVPESDQPSVEVGDSQGRVPGLHGGDDPADEFRDLSTRVVRPSPERHRDRPGPPGSDGQAQRTVRPTPGRRATPLHARWSHRHATKPSNPRLGGSFTPIRSSGPEVAQHGEDPSAESVGAGQLELVEDRVECFSNADLDTNSARATPASSAPPPSPRAPRAPARSAGPAGRGGAGQVCGRPRGRSRRRRADPAQRVQELADLHHAVLEQVPDGRSRR